MQNELMGKANEILGLLAEDKNVSARHWQNDSAQLGRTPFYTARGDRR